MGEVLSTRRVSRECETGKRFIEDVEALSIRWGCIEYKMGKQRV